MDNIRFAGYKWNIKSSEHPVGPGPNYFSKECVEIRNERLVLKVLEKDNQIFCSEVILTESLGYGRYCFYLSSRIDLLLPYLVFGLFTYDYKKEPHYNEIDIEFSKWGKTCNMNSQYVIQPYKKPGNMHRFNTELKGTHSTHVIEWRPDEINFTSIHGHHKIPPSEDYIIQRWKYKGPNIPAHHEECIHLNLWRCGNKSVFPDGHLEDFVALSNFTFEKF